MSDLCTQWLIDRLGAHHQQGYVRLKGNDRLVLRWGFNYAVTGTIGFDNGGIGSALHEQFVGLVRLKAADFARAMLSRFSEKFRKGLAGIHPEALAALETFPWPGNVRQLENVIQLSVLVASGPELLRAHLPAAIRDGEPHSDGGHGERLLTSA